MTKVWSSKTWLFWTGLLLLGLVLVVTLVSGSEISQALSPANGVTLGKTVSKVSMEPGAAPAPLYTLTFTNPTGSEVVLAAISDTLPAGFSFVDMHPLSQWQSRPDDDEEPVVVWQGPISVPAGETLSLVYSVDTFGVAPSSTPYVNTVEAVLDDGTPLGPSSASILLGTIDLDIDKQAQPMRVEGGGTVIYTVVISNTGHLTGTIDVISDTLDSSLTFVDMAAGSDVGAPLDPNGNPLVWVGPFEVLPLSALTMRYEVQAPDTETWVYPDNLVQADAQYKMLGPTGVQIIVGPQIGKLYLPGLYRGFRQAHLVFSKTAFPDSVTTSDGVEVIYTVTIQNVGHTTGKLSGLHDVLPTGFNYLGMAAGSDVADAPSISGQELTWNLASPLSIPAGGQKLVKYRVSHSQAEGQYTNLVTISAQGATVQEQPAQATVTVETGILLEDHFDAGIDQWTPFLNYHRQAVGQWYWGANDGYNGTGGVTMNRYAVPDKDAEDGLLMYLADGAEDWTDYRMEGKIIFRTDNHPSGFWVRGQWEPSEIRAQWVTGYYCMIGGGPTASTHYVRLLQLQTLEDCWGPPCPSSPEYEPGREINLYNFNNPHKLAEVKRDGRLNRNQWHTIRVDVRGDNIKIWLNGELYIDFTDPKEPFLTGTVGFKTYKADTVSYDDVIVTPLEPLD